MSVQTPSVPLTTTAVSWYLRQDVAKEVEQQVKRRRREDNDGEMKQVKEGVAGLTILKPVLAFLKAGVCHQLPSSFPLQRHKQTVLPE